MEDIIADAKSGTRLESDYISATMSESVSEPG